MATSKRDEPQTGTLARGVALAALAAVVLWALYLARNALLIIYISGLMAIGFGPVVRAIEHQTVVPVITRRLPRWLAILVVYYIVLIFFVAQQQIENHLLVPKVMERQVGVSAVTVIVALLVGGSILGITGAILAVPSAAILPVLGQVLLDERDRL